MIIYSYNTDCFYFSYSDIQKNNNILRKDRKDFRKGRKVPAIISLRPLRLYFAPFV